MLSRLSFRAVNALKRPLTPGIVSTVRCTATAPSGDSNDYSWYAKSGTKFPWEGPERDIVNFPRPVQPIEPGKTRFLFVPEEWFQFFYKKTGVTGPYVFAFGLYNYTMSKEIWIIDHEYYYVFASIGIIWYAYNKFGAKVADAIDKEVEKSNTELEAFQGDTIKHFESSIEDEKKSQWQFEGQKMLIDAKRENIAMQQEAAYRERAMQVYNEVRKRLEFHSQKQLMERRVSHKHMVNWIIQQVLKSITPQQEKDTLRKCLSDLQGLAAKA